MKKQFVISVLLLAFLQFAQAQLIPVDSCIVWQNKNISTNYFDVSPDSKFIATSGEDGIIRIYFLENGNLFKEINAFDGYVSFGGVGSVKYSNGGEYLVSCSYDCKIRIFETSTWDTIKTINTGYIMQYYATISHDSKYIAGTMGFEGIALWDFDTGQLLKIYPPFYAGKDYGPLAQSVEFSPDDKYIAIATDYNPGKLINIKNDSLVIVDELDNTFRSLFATISYDGTKFLTSYLSDPHIPGIGGVDVYDIQTKNFLRRFEMHCDVIDISVSPNNQYMVIGGCPTNYIIWDFNTGLPVTNWMGSVGYSKFSPDSNYLVIKSDGLILIDLRKITSVKENKQPIFTNIYPNPTTGNIKLEFNLIKSENLSVRISENSGRIINSTNLGLLESGSHSFDYIAPALASGIYFITIQGSSFLQTFNLVKE